MTKELKYNKYKIVFMENNKGSIEVWATNIHYHSNHITFTNLASRKINHINLSGVLYVEILTEGVSEETLNDILKAEIISEAYRRLKENDYVRLYRKT